MNAGEIQEGFDETSRGPSAPLPLLSSCNGAAEMIGAWPGFTDADDIHGDVVEQETGEQAVQPIRDAEPGGVGEVGEATNSNAEAEEYGDVDEEPDRRASAVLEWVRYGGMGAIVAAYLVLSNSPTEALDEDDPRAVYFLVFFVIFLLGLWLLMMWVKLEGPLRRR